MPMSDLAAQVVASKELTQEVALAARRRVYNDGAVDPHEVEALFALDEAAGRRDPAWVALFVEALVDFVVHQQRPTGYISEENADWLMARISRNGIVTTETELELLVKILEVTTSSPSRLSAFALGQVKAAVLHGKGPLACGGALQPGRVGRAEVELMRRILYAFGGDGNVAVTRAEAEVLFDINDATAAADNDSAWTDLFVKAVANCLMAASGYQAPSRQVALRQEAWLDGNSGGVRDFVGQMLAGGLRGALHDNEKALLRFIRAESPRIHPALQPLLERAA